MEYIWLENVITTYDNDSTIITTCQTEMDKILDSILLTVSSLR